MAFINERPEEIHLLSFQMDGQERLTKPPGEEARILDMGTTRGARLFELISEPEGLGVGRIAYRIGPDGAATTASFVIELRALEQCDLRVIFTGSRPQVGPCEAYRPASYGGTWRH